MIDRSMKYFNTYIYLFVELSLRHVIISRTVHRDRIYNGKSQKFGNESLFMVNLCVGLRADREGWIPGPKSQRFAYVTLINLLPRGNHYF